MAYPRSVEQIACELQGTCDSLLSVLERHDMEGAENDTAFCYALDALVFECKCCGWWFGQSEMSEINDWECTDCEE